MKHVKLHASLPLERHYAVPCRELIGRNAVSEAWWIYHSSASSPARASVVAGLASCVTPKAPHQRAHLRAVTLHNLAITLRLQDTSFTLQTHTKSHLTLYITAKMVKAGTSNPSLLHKLACIREGGVDGVRKIEHIWSTTSLSGRLKTL
jgi:hypothetical protein